MNPKALGPAVAVLLIFAAACSDGDDNDAAPPQSIVDDRTSGADDASSSGGADATDGTEATGDRGGASDGRRDGEAVGTTHAELPADLSDRRLVPLRIDVVRLERTGDLVELEMRLTNEADAAGQNPPGFTPYATFDAVSNGSSLSGVGLLVPGEQKLYLPVFDSENRCLCSSDLSSDVAAGESLPLNATFGGVPEDAETLDILVPSFPIINGVEVQG